MKHTYYLTDSDTEPAPIFIEPLEGEAKLYRVTLGEKSWDVDATLGVDGRLHMLIGGRSVCCDVEAKGDSRTVVMNGHSVSVGLMDERRFLRAKRGGNAVDDASEVLSPMTGRVVALLACAGAEVSVGQGLVIIEAMKMENEIKATRDGVVEECFVTAGETVEEGALILRFAEDAPEESE